MFFVDYEFEIHKRSCETGLSLGIVKKILTIVPCIIIEQESKNGISCKHHGIFLANKNYHSHYHSISHL